MPPKVNPLLGGIFYHCYQTKYIRYNHTFHNRQENLSNYINFQSLYTNKKSHTLEDAAFLFSSRSNYFLIPSSLMMAR